MQAGTLNQRGTIKSRVSGVDEIGQPYDTEQEIATVWLNVRYLNGVETLKAGAETSIARASLRMRYRNDITAAMTVTVDGTVFQVKAVLPGPRKVYLDLAAEVVS